ncbi:MAG: FISUMP domain-containing protein, partial [Bacteroidota bacterium]|nr:FISUMP domain-containing protein [Bacteroidota bacterium]
FSLLTESGYWWTASQTNSDLARVRKLFYHNNNFFNFDHKKENGFSVRCLLDTCTVYPSPSAIAGNDTLNLLDTFVVLQGNVPIIGSGHWSIVNGTGGIISDENNPNSVFSGLEIHEYTLVWSISNVCGYTCDTLHINFLCQTIPTQANAGPDQLNLIDTFTTLQANTPIAGTGHWSISTGTGGIISDINNPSTQFNGLLLHDYYLVWTVGNVCYNTYDTVHISFSCGLPPDQANAGPNQINLPDTFTVLQADTPSIGNGHWELIDGVGCEIANSTNPSSAFSGIQGHEYLLTWTVDNNNQCEPSIDTVHISFLCLSPPTQAFAGIDQINIPDTFTSLQANVAVSGVGQWNIQTGTGGQIYNLTNPTSQFHGLAANEYELIWTIGNICYSTSDTVTISFSCGLPPTQANAGPNQENIVDTFTILQANTPINGTGSWSILNDTGGMFSNIHDPSTVFYGQPLNEYDIIWTITNLCGETSDTVSIGFSCGLPPTQANAGPDQLNLVDAFTTLQANTPISGTGHWSIVSGVGGQLADIHAPNSQFNALPLNEYTLVWTIGNACNYTHDTVIISFSCGLPPTQANAGPDQLNIVSSLIELQGNYPFSGNGTWAIIDGTGGLLIYLGFDTYFSGSPDTTYYLTWTISNLCGESVDTIIVSQSCGPPPTQANAGPDQLNLVDTFTTLSANTPVSGNGQWSILSGTGGVIANTYQPCSQFSGIAGNQYSLVWTTYIFMTPICEQSRDTVVISFAPDTSSYSYGFSTSNSAINVTGAVQGICPTGWHLPNDTAWNELTSYIENDNGGTSNGYIFSINNYGVSTWTKVGGHLKTTLGWNNNGNSTNDYGFSAIHAGTRALNGFGYLGIRGFWWSSSFQYYAGMERFLLGYSNNFFNTYGINVEGTSVRCVKE